MTIREAILKGTLIFYFVVGNLIILLFAIALGATVQDGSTIITMFGKQIAPSSILGVTAVDFVLLQLYQNSTSMVILFGVFATAGLIPSMLEKGTVELYLSKPLSRTSLLLSRSLGACGGIGLNLIYFAVAIWIIFGLKVGVWHWGFLLASLLAIVTFFFYYSVVAFTALLSRSTGFSIMLAFIFSFFSSALEHRERMLYILWDNSIFHRTLDAVYYGTPQMSAMLDSASRLIGELPRPGSIDHVPPGFAVEPFLFSLLSASAIYALTAWYFSRQDY
jgi:ABC-type transport system involved in multi-copper enzyme maturation permease subunit